MKFRVLGLDLSRFVDLSLFLMSGDFIFIFENQISCTITLSTHRTSNRAQIFNFRLLIECPNNGEMNSCANKEKRKILNTSW